MTGYPAANLVIGAAALVVAAGTLIAAGKRWVVRPLTEWMTREVVGKLDKLGESNAGANTVTAENAKVAADTSQQLLTKVAEISDQVGKMSNDVAAAKRDAAQAVRDAAQAREIAVMALSAATGSPRAEPEPSGGST